MQNYNEVIDEGLREEEKSFILGNEESQVPNQKEKLLLHFSVLVPKVEIAFVSKKQGNYSRYFMLF
jgi:hypothetical protein